MAACKEAARTFAETVGFIRREREREGERERGREAGREGGREGDRGGPVQYCGPNNLKVMFSE